MTTVRQARPEAPEARCGDGEVGGVGDGFAAAVAGVGLPGAWAVVRAGTGVVVGFEGDVGVALVAEGAGEAGGLGVWREAARRWGAPEQDSANMGTSSTS